MACRRNKCIYKGTNTDTCDYLLITGKPRGCPAGAKCTRYSTGKKARKVPKLPTTFKKGNPGLFVAFESMYEEGFSDQQIADALGVSKEIVGKWRRGERLPSRETRRQIMAAHEKATAVLNGGGK